jgi:2-oxopent-4-enoate/cis-2-oxohex-4-enoate hydratase
VPLSLCPNRKIESEICFRLTADLPARERHYRPEEVAEAVVACASLELVDTRFDTGYRPLRQMLDSRATRLEAFADHNTTGAFVVGDARADWRGFDFAELRLVMTAGDKVLFDTVGGHALDDPFLPAVVLVNRMRHRGGLSAGQILVTGSFTGFTEVEPDTPVVADFKGFGKAEARYVSE